MVIGNGDTHPSRSLKNSAKYDKNITIISIEIMIAVLKESPQ